ncbi:peroxide/acid stress response protein YhcN [Rouxiella sp. Mn2063]|uniref:peroxide/acid stress response protein YhcN n=1 Tax=Rouxiella sp. Mn2063 TaxID=3395262 RepID=UPI003BD2AFB6
MNIKTTISALSILSVLSFSAFSAQPINQNQAQNLQPIGVINVSGINGTPSDIRQALSDKADAQGAKTFRVIEVRQEGNYHATAEIYQ